MTYDDIRKYYSRLTSMRKLCVDVPEEAYITDEIKQSVIEDRNLVPKFSEIIKEFYEPLSKNTDFAGISGLLVREYNSTIDNIDFAKGVELSDSCIFIGRVEPTNLRSLTLDEKFITTISRHLTIDLHNLQGSLSSELQRLISDLSTYLDEHSVVRLCGLYLCGEDFSFDCIPTKQLHSYLDRPVLSDIIDVGTLKCTDLHTDIVSSQNEPLLFYLFGESMVSYSSIDTFMISYATIGNKNVTLLPMSSRLSDFLDDTCNRKVNTYFTSLGRYEDYTTKVLKYSLEQFVNLPRLKVDLESVLNWRIEYVPRSEAESKHSKQVKSFIIDDENIVQSDWFQEVARNMGYTGDINPTQENIDMVWVLRCPCEDASLFEHQHFHIAAPMFEYSSCNKVIFDHIDLHPSYVLMYAFYFGIKVESFDCPNNKHIAGFTQFMFYKRFDIEYRNTNTPELWEQVIKLTKELDGRLVLL